MKKIITIVGARPQIIKSAAISRVIRDIYSEQLTEVLVHTGQHYSEALSDIFFKELELTPPHYNIQVGSASHGVQTADMMKGLEGVIEKEKPDAVLLYGDTNSTLSGALVASKMKVPIIHVESGMRSFNKEMPEEINRIVCDHISTLLFTPTQAGIENLKNEGFKLDNSGPFTIDNPKVFHCGDIMYDNSLFYGEKVKDVMTPFELSLLREESYFICTVHRPENTDQPEKLINILKGLLALTKLYPKHLIYMPLHPRTKSRLNSTIPEAFKKQIEENKQFKMIPPISYLNMIALQQNCDVMITDSGGLQKEAYFFNKPTVILRGETEWKEVVDQGVAVLAGADEAKITAGVEAMMKQREASFPLLYGDGKAAEFIAEQIIKYC